ncbi:NAD(P)H-dependent oxidoreductase [Thalassotalea psychrophila]|uniref:NAD(P)H-dependent oxidoreductase n=1 Tax=Thalassotalea psychrophila TaxID=3065647 RepID=A0ABY9TUP1_9GAMM|nr:NAD(P)H-dependent oxidoreductase [Colwelliaceae bacterium SQ149]
MSKILAFSGSARKNSFNQQLVSIAASGAQAAGADVNVINLLDFPMPIFNQDDETENGMPKFAQQFKKLISEHDGFLIASPEYNSSCSPLLINAIAWASRANTPDEVPLSAFQGKYATIMAASPGALGGLRSLVTLRMLLGNIDVTVLPEQIAIAKAYSTFEQGKLIDEIKHNKVREMGASLHKLLTKLNPDIE